MVIPINTPDAVPNELIVASWGDTVRADLIRIRDNKIERDGSIAMTGMLLLPSSNPSNNNHATRKGWVDATFIHVGGDAMTGNLNMQNHVLYGLPTPTAANHAANKTYVDTTTVSRTGDTMTGILTLDGADGAGANAAMRRAWIVDTINAAVAALRADHDSRLDDLRADLNALTARVTALES